MWKKNEAFCLPTSGGSGQYIVTPTTKTEREESDMSMENELKRIADCLERIEKNMGVSLQVEKEEPPVPGVSTKKSKKKKGAEEEPVELTMVAGEDPEKTLTPAGLMSYCNTELTKIKDVPKRTAIIKKVVAMFKEDFGVSSVKETPADKVAEAKAAFDAIVKEG